MLTTVILKPGQLRNEECHSQVQGHFGLQQKKDPVSKPSQKKWTKKHINLAVTLGKNIFIITSLQK